MVKFRFGKLLIPAALAAFGLAGTAQAQRDMRTIPANTVIRAELEKGLSSRSARVGDQVVARLDEEDRSGFPEGTRFEGKVTDVRRASRKEPGMIGARFTRALLPGGQAMAVQGTLSGLDEDDYRRTRSGRLESRGSSGKFDTKWVGYGAAGGAILSTIFGGGLLKGGLIGALGGAAYAYLKKDKQRNGGRYSDVQLKPGAEFGLRLNNRVAFHDSNRYRYTSTEEDEPGRNDRERDRDDRDR
jgi:hypothetical protein